MVYMLSKQSAVRVLFVKGHPKTIIRFFPYRFKKQHVS